ncbi:MAG TPA: efflux RND transporter permease subunit, partial [Planctomycetota bacterium]|nr:efflux RND transporter permease subunit [Planctomycetota bacterium]
MRGLPAWSASRPIATSMVALMVVLVGAFSLLRLPLDLLPDVSLPSLTVRVEYGTAAPEEVERLVTEHLEGSIALAEGVEEITSESSEGSARITVRFGWGTDLATAADDVRERLDQVADELPEDLPRPLLRRFDVSASPIVILGVSSSMDQVELTRTVEEVVAYRLERIPGVAEVDLWGESTREIRVELDLQRLQALVLAPEQVVAALRAANVDVPAGSVDSGRMEVTVRTPGQFEDLEELADTVVAVRSGEPVRVADVATVLDTHEDQTRIVRIDGEPGLRLGVRKQSDANTAEVAAAVLREVDELARDLPQLRVVPVQNQGLYIERAVRNVGSSVLYGGALAVVVLLFFLRSVRSTLVVATAIPISVIATFGLVHLAGFTLNLMTLGGLALGVGMMVDCSIVVLENVYRRRHEEGEGGLEATVRGAAEVAPAIVASTVTTLVIFMPLVFLGGVSGVLFGELAAVVAFSLVVSLLVALTVVPSLTARLLGRERGAPHARP